MKILAILLACAITCDGFTTYYSSTGQYLGSAYTVDGRTFYRGPTGEFAGSSTATNSPNPLPPAPYTNPFEEPAQ